MVSIKDFASNSIMGVVRKIVNYIVDTLQVQVQNNTDHLPSAFNGSFDDSTKNLTLTIESQGASAENLTTVVNIPTSGSGGTTYNAGNGINITSGNEIEIDTSVTATLTDVDTKVAKNQGTANAGKVLGIGSDGMVAPVDAGSSSGNWVQLETNTIPMDNRNKDYLIRVTFGFSADYNDASSCFIYLPKFYESIYNGIDNYVINLNGSISALEFGTLAFINATIINNTLSVNGYDIKNNSNITFTFTNNTNIKASNSFAIYHN